MSKRHPEDQGPHDLELWHRVMHDVKPLRGRDRPAARGTKESTSVSAKEQASPGERSASRPATVRRAVPPPSGTPEIRHGTVAGVDRRSAERMKRGRLAIEAQIDLHGLTQQRAHEALTRFLAKSQAAGRRCVLVITGKGVTRDEAGVLRRLVPLWLNQEPNRGRVLAFDYAQQRHGGLGAIYVLLRRPRGAP